MSVIGDFLQAVLEGLGNLIRVIPDAFSAILENAENSTQIYTAFARWVFIFLALFILLKSILSLLKSKNPSEVWAYLHIGEGRNVPLTHWENVLGRAKSCDVQIDEMSVSRNHGTLTRDNDGIWKYMDLGSKNGAVLNGRRIRSGSEVEIKSGDILQLGAVECTMFPISVQERRNNILWRTEDTILLSPWPSLFMLTVFQLMTVLQLYFSLGKSFNMQIPMAFGGMAILMWVYVIVLRGMKRRGFEMETIAFFLSTLSLAVTSTCLPNQVMKQFIAIAIGVGLFFFMCTFMRDLERVISVKKPVYILAAVLLIFNLIFATTLNGASNWVQLGPLSVQPSEIVKLAFIWVGAASLDELFDQKNTLTFTIFSLFCFACLALMGDFGTALIFFATFLIISFLRSGDFTKLIVVAGAALVAGLLVIRFASYIQNRFAVWGHVWDPANINDMGFQQTRTMVAAASGGYVGLGAGNGWLRNIVASETDLVFGVLTEEWGLIIAVMAVLSILTLAVFAYRSIMSARSTYYTIAACSATTIFLLQTVLNVFGSVDLLPLTGVTFPFVSSGGTSIIACWGLLAFLKAADTRQNASIAVSLRDRGLGEESDEV